MQNPELLQGNNKIEIWTNEQKQRAYLVKFQTISINREKCTMLLMQDQTVWFKLQEEREEKYGIMRAHECISMQVLLPLQDIRCTLDLIFY